MAGKVASPDSFTFTVGKLDAGMAILLGDRAHLIEFPSILLPPGATTGSIVNIAVHQNHAAERKRDAEFWELQDKILDMYGHQTPEAPDLQVRNVTQTSVTLEWPPLHLATAKLRSLDIYRNSQRLAAIPAPLTNTSTKVSGLDMSTNYTFQLVLRTTAGTYPSPLLTVRTHAITDTSGICVCFGNVQDDVLLANTKAALEEMGARWSEKIQIDTTHFVCTTPAATPSGARASGSMAGAPGVDYQRALQLSIPVVQPHWVLACHAEKRMVPIAPYYLGATPHNGPATAGVYSSHSSSNHNSSSSSPYHHGSANRPQSMSGPYGQIPHSAPVGGAGGGGVRASMPPPARSGGFVSSGAGERQATGSKVGFESSIIREEERDEPEGGLAEGRAHGHGQGDGDGEDQDQETPTKEKEKEKRKSKVGTMNTAFKFPPEPPTPDIVVSGSDDDDVKSKSKSKSNHEDSDEKGRAKAKEKEKETSLASGSGSGSTHGTSTNTNSNTSNSTNTSTSNSNSGNSSSSNSSGATATIEVPPPPPVEKERGHKGATASESEESEDGLGDDTVDIPL